MVVRRNRLRNCFDLSLQLVCTLHGTFSSSFSYGCLLSSLSSNLSIISSEILSLTNLFIHSSFNYSHSRWMPNSRAKQWQYESEQNNPSCRGACTQDMGGLGGGRRGLTVNKKIYSKLDGSKSSRENKAGQRRLGRAGWEGCSTSGKILGGHTLGVFKEEAGDPRGWREWKKVSSEKWSLEGNKGETVWPTRPREEPWLTYSTCNGKLGQTGALLRFVFLKGHSTCSAETLGRKSQNHD